MELDAQLSSLLTSALRNRGAAAAAAPLSRSAAQSNVARAGELAARRDGLWQAEGAPPPAVLFSRAAGAALLGGCAVPAPCANRTTSG